ncbi:2Fe-2S iron-sulfur cluster binding domain-containing protein [bacterium]|nr:2Fe-2S iron-sulfur cluster binding domain-containing protein [bacterium]
MERPSTVEVWWGDLRLELPQGANLRTALLEAGVPPYNGRAALLNCRGLGSCGTCAVRIIEGSMSAPSGIERWRLRFPPHRANSAHRLACQISVDGPLKLIKDWGFWGQGEQE